ncbi:MAG TPA: hypothetical protein VFX53_04595 [Pedococcus sp.]|nr:hypothetical protein [Pedococcus sp.]
MIEQVNVNAGRCDGCDKVRLGTTEHGPVIGFMGKVTGNYPDGSQHEAHYYACRERCLGKAAVNSLHRVLAEEREQEKSYTQGELA